MSLLRRGKPDQTKAAEPEPTRPATPPPAQLSPQMERAILSLTNRMQDCFERLDAIEARLDELTENANNAPSHSDVLEVRIHSAKLAAELARATVELRGEIGMASDEARRAARLAQSPDSDDVPVALPVDLDLTREEKAERRGWSASA